MVAFFPLSLVFVPCLWHLDVWRIVSLDQKGVPYTRFICLNTRSEPHSRAKNMSHEEMRLPGVSSIDGEPDGGQNNEGSGEETGCLTVLK